MEAFLRLAFPWRWPNNLDKPLAAFPAHSSLLRGLWHVWNVLGGSAMEWVGVLAAWKRQKGGIHPFLSHRNKGWSLECPSGYRPTSCSEQHSCHEVTTETGSPACFGMQAARSPGSKCASKRERPDFSSVNGTGCLGLHN